MKDKKLILSFLKWAISHGYIADGDRWRREEGNGVIKIYTNVSVVNRFLKSITK